MKKGILTPQKHWGPPLAPEGCAFKVFIQVFFEILVVYGAETCRWRPPKCAEKISRQHRTLMPDADMHGFSADMQSTDPPMSDCVLWTTKMYKSDIICDCPQRSIGKQLFATTTVFLVRGEHMSTRTPVRRQTRVCRQTNVCVGHVSTGGHRSEQREIK